MVSILNLLNETNLVNDFLKQASPNEIKQYSMRDNCGIAALDMIEYAKKHDKLLTRVSGYFIADKIVSSKKDFTNEMRDELILDGVNFNDDKLRYEWIMKSKYKNTMKEIPHYWLIDKQGNIYDPSGYLQFIKRGYATDLNSWRYKQEN